MIVAINYSNENFRLQQNYNTKTAYRYGKVDKVIEYSPNDLDSEFVNQNKELLSVKKGGGLWLWKPYIILKTLKTMNEGDFLIYSDSGSVFCNDVHYLTKVLDNEKQDILAFVISLLEIQWTKRETFEFFNETDFSRNQFLGGFLLLRKTDYAIRFIEEWLSCMTNPICSSPIDHSINPFSSFIAHRQDQSVLSLLCYKYNVIPHRDPSEYGDYPWLYKYEKYSIRYWTFHNSPYPRIFLLPRKVNPIIYKRKMFIKDLLNKLGLLRLLFDRYPGLDSNHSTSK